MLTYVELVSETEIHVRRGIVCARHRDEVLLVQREIRLFGQS
jgi:hypothetical protein